MSLPHKHTGSGGTLTASPAASSSAAGTHAATGAAAATAAASAARPSSRPRSSQVTGGVPAGRDASLPRHPSASSSHRASSSSAGLGQPSSRRADGGAAAAAASGSSAAAASAAPPARSARRAPPARPVVSLSLNAFTDRKFLLDYVASRDRGLLQDLLCELGAQIVLQQDGPDVTLVYDGAKQMTAAVHNGANNRFLNAANKKAGGASGGLMESRLDRARRMDWPHLRYEEALAKVTEEKKRCEDCTVRVIITASSKLFEPEITEFPLVRQLTVPRNRQTGQAAAAPVLGPLVHTIPRLDWDAPRGACPFISGNDRLDEIGRKQQEAKEKRKAAHMQAKFEAQQQKAALEAGGAAAAAASSSAAASASAVPAAVKPVVHGRPQYCEFCAVYIEDEQTHFNTPQHQELFDRPERREFARLHLLEMERTARFLRAAEAKAPKYRAIALAKAAAREAAAKEAAAAATAVQPKATSTLAAVAASSANSAAAAAQSAAAAAVPASTVSLADASSSFAAASSTATAASAARASASARALRPPAPPVPVFHESLMDWSAQEPVAATAASSSPPQPQADPAFAPSSTACPIEVDEPDTSMLDAASPSVAASAVVPVCTPLAAVAVSESFLSHDAAAAASISVAPALQFDDERKEQEPPVPAAANFHLYDPEPMFESKESVAEKDSPPASNPKSPSRADSLLAILSPRQLSLAPMEPPIILAAASTLDLPRHAAGLFEAPESMKLAETQKLDADTLQDECKDQAVPDSTAEQQQDAETLEAEATEKLTFGKKRKSSAKKQTRKKAVVQAVDATDDPAEVAATDAAASPSEAALPAVTAPTSPVTVARSSRRKRSAPTRLAEEPDEPAEAPAPPAASASASPVTTAATSSVTTRNTVKPKQTSNRSEQQPATAELASWGAAVTTEVGAALPTESDPSLALSPSELRSQKAALRLWSEARTAGGLPAQRERRSRQAAKADASAAADSPAAKRESKKPKPTKPNSVTQEAEDNPAEIPLTRHVTRTQRRSRTSCPSISEIDASAPVAGTDETAEAAPASAAADPATATAAAPAAAAATPATSSSASASAKKAAAAAKRAATLEAKRAAKAAEAEAAALADAAAASAATGADSTAADHEKRADNTAAAATHKPEPLAEQSTRAAEDAAPQVKTDATAAAASAAAPESATGLASPRLVAGTAAAKATSPTRSRSAKSLAPSSVSPVVAAAVSAASPSAASCIRSPALPREVRHLLGVTNADAPTAGSNSPWAPPVNDGGRRTAVEKAANSAEHAGALRSAAHTAEGALATQQAGRSAEIRARLAQAAQPTHTAAAPVPEAKQRTPPVRPTTARAVPPASTHAAAAAAAVSSPPRHSSGRVSATRQLFRDSDGAANPNEPSSPSSSPSSPSTRSSIRQPTREFIAGGAAAALKSEAKSAPSRFTQKRKYAEEQREWEVESILRHRGFGKNREYLVKWVGYDAEKDLTWEPPSSLKGCPEILADYHRRFKADAKKLDEATLLRAAPEKPAEAKEAPQPAKHPSSIKAGVLDKSEAPVKVPQSPLPSKRARTSAAPPAASLSYSSASLLLTPAGTSFDSDLRESPVRIHRFMEFASAQGSSPCPSPSPSSSPSPPPSSHVPKSSLSKLARGGPSSSKAVHVSPMKARPVQRNTLEGLKSPLLIAASSAVVAASAASAFAAPALVSPPVRQRSSAALPPHSASEDEMFTPPSYAQKTLRPNRRGAEISSLQESTPTLLSGPAKRNEWSSAKQPAAPTSVPFSFAVTPTPAAAAASSAAAATTSPRVGAIPFNLRDALDDDAHSTPLTKPAHLQPQSAHSKRKQPSSASVPAAAAAASSQSESLDPYAWTGSPAKAESGKKQKVSHATAAPTAAAAAAPTTAPAAAASSSAAAGQPSVAPAFDPFAFDLPATPQRPPKEEAKKPLLLASDKGKGK